MSELPIATIERILKNAWAPRVSEDAKEALVKALEEYGENISKHAVLQMQNMLEEKLSYIRYWTSS